MSAAEVQHVGKVYANDRNTAFAPAYTIGNLQAGFAQSAGRAKFTEYVRAQQRHRREIHRLGDRRRHQWALFRAGAGTQLVRRRERGSSRFDARR